MHNFQIPNNLDPLARIGAYFRDKQLKRALSIVVLPGQATGKINDVVDKDEIAYMKKINTVPIP